LSTIFDLRIYYAETRRSEAIVSSSTHTYDFDFQHRFMPARRNEFMWGAGYRSSDNRLDGTFLVSFQPNRHLDRLYTTFLQDEIALIPDRLYLTVGSKFEHNDYTGFEAQPSARLLWTPSVEHTAWAAVSRAVRTPALSDFGLRVNYAVFPGPRGVPTVLSIYGSSQLRSETVISYEAGYRVQPHHRFSLDLATFYNVYGDLYTSEPGAPIQASEPQPHLVVPAYLTNLMRGETYGAEVATHFRPAWRWRLSTSYSWLSMQMHRDRTSQDSEAEEVEGQTPRHQFQVRSYLDLPGKLEWDSGFYWVGSLPKLNVPSYGRLDTRIGRRFAERLEVSVGLQNLLDNRHPEFPPIGSLEAVEIGRSVYGKITWRF